MEEKEDEVEGSEGRKEEARKDKRSSGKDEGENK